MQYLQNLTIGEQLLDILGRKKVNGQVLSGIEL